jgi:hypothetical protein
MGGCRERSIRCNTRMGSRDSSAVPMSQTDYNRCFMIMIPYSQAFYPTHAIH